MSNFDAAEIFRFAVRIEENGEKLYRRAAGISDDEKTRYMFNFLADQEIKHKEFFGNILCTLDFSAFPFETYPGEYVEYMRNYLDRQKIFNEKNEKESLGISDIISAVNFAHRQGIRFDPVLFGDQEPRSRKAAGEGRRDNLRGAEAFCDALRFQERGFEVIRSIR